MTISRDMVMVMMGQQFRKAVMEFDLKQKYLVLLFLPFKWSKKQVDFLAEWIFR